MKDMYDCEGKKVHEGELIKIIDRPDLAASADFWTVFDCLEVGIFTDFILKNCVTNEIKIVSQANIKRTY
jgi:hypothetical protein